MDAMLDDVFAEAIVHKPIPWLVRLRNLLTRHSSPVTGHVVLGLRLRPFSYWHAFNLDLVGNAAKNLNQFSSLLLAARCCRLRYPNTIAASGFFEALRYQIGSLRFSLRFAKSEACRIKQTKAYLDYRKDYAECLPELADSGESVKLPWYLFQVHVLKRVQPSLTLAQAWDTQVATSQWNLLGHFAAAGAKIDILTPEDRKDLEAVNSPPAPPGARAPEFAEKDLKFQKASAASGPLGAGAPSGKN